MPSVPLSVVAQENGHVPHTNEILKFLAGSPWTNARGLPSPVSADGSTEDTVAFEGKSTETGSGGILKVPSGTHIVDTVTLSTTKQRLELAPGAILKLKSTSTSGETLQLRADFLIIEGGEIDGNKAAATGVPNSGDAIEVRNSYIRLIDLYVHDTGGYGILGATIAAGTAQNDIEVRGSVFKDTVNTAVFFNNAAAGATTPANGIRIISCWADNSAVAAATVAGSGFSVKGSSSAKTRGGLIADCYVKGRADATADIGGIGLSYCNGAQAVGCFVEGTGFAYTYPDSDNIATSGCVAFGPKSYGFEL